MSQNDAEVAVLYPNLVTAAEDTAMSGTTARSGTALAVGRHRVVSTVDCYLRQGTVTVEATTADSFIAAGVIDYIFVDGAANNYLAGITAGGAGVMFTTLQAA